MQLLISILLDLLSHLIRSLYGVAVGVGERASERDKQLMRYSVVSSLVCHIKLQALLHRVKCSALLAYFLCNYTSVLTYELYIPDKSTL